MYRFYLNGITNEYHLEELAREFLLDQDFEMIPVAFCRGTDLALIDKRYLLNRDGVLDYDGIKRELYRILSHETAIYPEWGTLTGVRPLKLAFQHYDALQDVDLTFRSMKEQYLLSDAKCNLLRKVMEYQLEFMERPSESNVSLYVHIPFCPTRCSYCSFATNVAGESEIENYLHLLLQEIKYTGRLFQMHDQKVESVYVGGGTPTTLNEKQLTRLIECLRSSFSLKLSDIEFTMEAGRPDTITKGKLRAMRDAGVDRISINPQSMKQETLSLIGRSHRPEDIIQAFDDAAEIGFRTVNSDVIAGLPGENPADFEDTLRALTELGANNITVHTLSVKRGSELKNRDPEYYRRNTEAVRSMLRFSESFLGDKGFRPYYIYRQKHQMGSFENVGYCKPGAHSAYNVRIMEEKQTIIGMGAGAIGKRYFPSEDRLERIPNVANYRIYEERLDEMLLRKNNYWGGRDGD